MKQGQMHANGHAWCGGCWRRVNKVKGAKRRRKREGWTYTFQLGWLCPACSHWPKPAKRPSSPLPTGSNVGNSELSTRFGPRTLGDSRTEKEAETRVANLPPMARLEVPSEMPSGKRRAQRLTARGRTSMQDAMSSSQWLEWKRRHRRN